MTYPQPTAYGTYPAQQHPQQPPALPPSQAGWVVAAIVFFWPVAFSAANHAFSVYPKWAAGDFAGAQYASDRAKKLGKIALAVFAILILAYVVFVGIAIAVGINEAASVSSDGY